MRLDLDRIMILALLLWMPRSLAEELPAATSATLASDALCGRANENLVLAQALDKVESTAFPEAWSALRISALRQWLESPQCKDAKDEERAASDRRRKTLKELLARLGRNQVMVRFERAVNELPPRPNAQDTWPSSSDCRACGALRTASSTTAAAASSWPPLGDPEKLPAGLQFEEATLRRQLMRQICEARTPRAAPAEITKSFQYYTWTTNGARLMKLAAWFERPEVVAGCRQ